MGKKYAVNSDFFSVWSKEMSYVLGFFYADGGMERSVTNRAWYARFSSTDRDLLEQIADTMNAEHPLIVRDLPLPNKTGYILRIGDKKLYSTLERIGLYPNKSLTIKMPAIPREFLADFIRGYFDGDGCVSIERQSKIIDGTRRIKRLHTSFTSGSAVFLEQLSGFLNEEIKVFSKIYRSDRSFQLRYSTVSSIRIFKYLYNGTTRLYLRRKFNKFTTFFSERPDWIDSDIQTILDYHS
jgi:hypothetical protein